MKRLCVIAPHPDDEILGAGGTILKAVAKGSDIFWLIVTAIYEKEGYSTQQVNERNEEIIKLSKDVPFKEVTNIGFPTATLSNQPEGKLISEIKSAIIGWKPDTVIMPWHWDAHTDHNVVFNCVASVTKTFRMPFIKTIMSMEIVSETNYARFSGFVPNWYINISEQLDRKIELLNIFKSELGTHPFPRSEQSIRALATLRGSESGFKAAEAFHLLKHRYE